jgi:serine/threonine-protein kinase SRPK3
MLFSMAAFPLLKILLTFNPRGIVAERQQYCKNFTLENSLTSFTGEDKTLFLQFIRRMLRWMPEDRATAGELLKDPWLNRG